MDETWVNNHIDKYGQNGQSVNAMATTYDSYMFNKSRDNRSRAYVNPCIVKCAAAYSNAINVIVPKKIHINPNFKGHRTILGNDKTQESTLVHVNPYFGRSKLNYPRNDQLQQTLFHTNNKLKDIATVDEKKNNESNGKKLINKCKGHSNIIPGGCKSDNNPRYMHFTKAKSAPTVTISKSATLNMPSQTKERDKNGDMFGNLSNIKTRHKIVHVDNLKSVHAHMNSKRKVLNRYKLINVGRSESDADKSSNQISGQERGVISNLKPISLKEERGQIFSENLQLLKLKHSLKRNSSVNRITNSIKSKYIYQNKTLCSKKRPGNLFVTSKHKLDRREIGPETNHSQKKSLSKTVLQHKVKTVSCLWKSSSSKLKYHNHFIWRKQQRSGSNRQGIKTTYPNRTVIKIGGIMYKSSSNKLTRAKDKKREVRTTSDSTFVASKMRHQIVYVRGEKFLLDSSGKTLIRQSKTLNTTGGNKSVVRRIDLGGVTFIQQSQNVLIRTNTHQARQLVHSAKQRSIALLNQLHKRNNMPCMIYQRFGICRRHKQGMCIYVHDPKNIDLCKKFLKGECHNRSCPLSHDAVKEKMATCHFFLKGKCNKENCPYLHVKVNKKAVICRDFLQGFCNLGQNCTKRHMHRCPEFEEKGTCSRSASCPYPHKTRGKRKTKGSDEYNITKYELTKRVSTEASAVKKGSSKEKIGGKTLKKNAVRTKCENSVKRKMKMEGRLFEVPQTEEIGNDSIVECIPKRVKLTDLPLFIPLNAK